jgi:hypothetical protein
MDFRDWFAFQNLTTDLGLGAAESNSASPMIDLINQLQPLYLGGFTYYHVFGKR